MTTLRPRVFDAPPMTYGDDWLSDTACPILSIFVRLWADASSTPQARGAVKDAVGDLDNTLGSTATEARRMLGIAAWGENRYVMLIDWLSGDPDAQAIIADRSYLTGLTARRTYSYTPRASFAAWLAPPIESPRVPDVLIAAEARIRHVGTGIAQREFERLSARSFASAAVLIRSLAGKT